MSLCPPTMLTAVLLLTTIAWLVATDATVCGWATTSGKVAGYSPGYVRVPLGESSRRNDIKGKIDTFVSESPGIHITGWTARSVNGVVAFIDNCILLPDDDNGCR